MSAVTVELLRKRLETVITDLEAAKTQLHRLDGAARLLINLIAEAEKQEEVTDAVSE